MAATASLRALCESLIDYAGLFPPASLGMAPAVANYARYLRSAESWMLGRFITPAARLDEFEAAASTFWSEPGPCWRVSVLVSENTVADLAAIRAFNAKHGATNRVLIDSIEYRLQKIEDVTAIATVIPANVTAYLEVPIATPNGGFDSTAPELFLDAVLTAGAHSEGSIRAKIRTGGVKAEMIPPATDVLRFIAACAERNLAFKATAGLHHATAGSYPLTYERNATCGSMHGFLNLFLASAALFSGSDRRTAADIFAFAFAPADTSTFQFTDREFRGNNFSLSTEQINHCRKNFAIAYGSCSFEEPVADLRALNLL